jgi:RimJ/RimL family protein N-acetyltransferase
MDAVAADEIQVRSADDADRRSIALLFAAVAEERDGIAAEPPVDVEATAARWNIDGTFVAEADQVIVGEIGMMVADGWRGSGVGTALVAAAIDQARARGLHKLALSVFPHNGAAIALYRKFGFVEEGRLTKHIRRANGELWDLIEMGLLL